ncbi:hypothetical protein CN386_28680, partial [Bacillus cereus]
MQQRPFQPDSCRQFPCAFPISSSGDCCPLQTVLTSGQQQQLLQLLGTLNSALQAFFQNPNATTSQNLQNVLTPLLTLLQQLPSTPQTKYTIRVLQQLLTALQDPKLPIENISQLTQLFLEALTSVVQTSNLSPDALRVLFRLILQSIINSLPQGTTPSISVNPGQVQGLEVLLAQLTNALSAFFSNPDATTATALQQQFNQLLTLLNTFPSNPQTESLKTLTQNLLTLLQDPNLNPGLISQLTSQLFNGLSAFFGTLILDPATLQTLIQALIDAATKNIPQGTAPSIPVDPTQSQQLQQLLQQLPTLLQTYITNPDPTNALNLQNLLSQFLTLLKTFPSNPQTEFSKQLLQNIITLLQDPNTSPSQVTQLLQQFLNALSSFFSTLILDPTTLQALINALLQALNTATNGPHGPTGITGLTGDTGPTG